MTLSQIKSTYFSRLKYLYPNQEIEGIFAIIARQVLNYSKIDIHLNKDEKIQASEVKKMESFLDRLTMGEPVQYIIGETEFCGLKLKVDPRVLIPRPETEYMVDTALQFIPKDKPQRIIDLCTGSGCIAIALSKNLPLANMTAIDVSGDSIKLAKKNSVANQTDITFFTDDLLNLTVNYELYNFIICNPPYVRESEKMFMHKNILEFEPANALFVKDSDPLLFYRAIAEFGGKYLVNDGIILAEINENLGKETSELFVKYDFDEVFIRRDLNNKDRFIIARKK
jgi:release factor glutamine methyltransferase